MQTLNNIISELTKNENYDWLKCEQIDKNIFPFNKYEYLFSHLLNEGKITIEQYEEIRTAYMSRNVNLALFSLSPRIFGEKWGQEHIKKLVPNFKSPSKDLDENYSGEYDLWYNDVKIEVKSSRAVDKDKKNLPLQEKALSYGEEKRYDMNFQQIKTSCCDIFIWCAVWKDKIIYWVLSADEVKNNKYYSNGQHRGNEGEGQLWIKDSNIEEFDEYRVPPEEILNKVQIKSKNIIDAYFQKHPQNTKDNDQQQ